MAVTSVRFAVFAWVLLAIYYRIPGKQQWKLLLLASALFYLGNGWGSLALISLTAVSSFCTARQIERNRERFPEEQAKRRNRIWLTGCLSLNFGILALCKGKLVMSDGFLLPMGISFYMFQSMGYVMDVSRRTVSAQKNFPRFLLFVSYFPQLIQGPISRYSVLESKLFVPHNYEAKPVSLGLQRMLWGYFKKLVIADRIAVAVSTLLEPQYTGGGFLVLMVFYGVQIYGDFTGGMDIVLGLSQALGIPLPENFRHPFFSKNTAQYWRRWHITLGEWMKTYIFYPVSVSPPILRLSRNARKRFGRFGKRLPVYIASAVTWFVTGIWHGLTPNFVLWGMLNCMVILLSEELTPLFRKFHSRFPWKKTSWYGAFEILRTFLLMNLIRACDLFADVGEYVRRVGSLFFPGSLSCLWDGTLLNLGLSALDYAILGCGICMMIAVSFFQVKHGSIREFLWQRPVLRELLMTGLFLVILLMGRYGVGYDASSFIYNRF